jgi:hypothetical protein
MIDETRHSIIAGDDGEGTPNTSARTATTFRQRSGGRRATAHRQGQDLQRSANGGRPLGQSIKIIGDGENNNNDGSRSRSDRNETGGRQATMNYIEIKQIIERQMIRNKRGKLTDTEIQALVKDWHDQREGGGRIKSRYSREGNKINGGGHVTIQR